MKRLLLAGAGAGALMLAAVQAHAAEVAAAAEAAGSVEELVVYGKGESRQVQSIPVQDIEQAAPGTSPLKVIEKLPGVNFQSADAFGAYEWSTRISIRGFNQNQLGFTLDGVPLGDMSYGNFNGLHISRAIASEDLGGAELAQGAGSLETASTSNLGGSLKFVSRAPSDAFGVLAAATYGSNNMWRGFVRLDTGVLPTGGKAYLSFANQEADKWKGDGRQKQQQIDFKFVQPIGDYTFTGFYDWSRRRENDYQDMSLDMLNRLGNDWDNDSGNWNEAVQIAKAYQNPANYAGASPILDGNGCYTGSGANPYPGKVKCVDDTYFNASGLRNDELWAATFAGPVGPLKASGTVYGHTNDGQGTWYTPYVPSPNYGVVGATTDNAPISVRTTEYSISRVGVIGAAAWDLGPHHVSFGGWYEDNDFNQARRFYGLNLASPQRDSLKFMTSPFFTQWAYAFTTKTTQGYVEDVWTVNDALKVNFGFKSLHVVDKATTTKGAPLLSGSITSEDGFLPQVGATWKVNDDHELFAGYTENMRAFGAAHTGLSPFASNQAGFDVIIGKTKLSNGQTLTLQPETSKTFEAGWRFHVQSLSGVAAVYYVKFDNRLIGTSTGAGIVGNPTILANAGGVTSKGFETAATWRIDDAWSLFGSYAYNDSTYDDDVKDPSTGLVTHKISGKTTMDAPKHLLNAELAYGHDGWFANLGAHYTSKRFFTYTNDQSVDAFTTVDLAAGYRFTGEGWSHGLEIQANVTNLLDDRHIATIGSNGFGFSGDNQTLLPGAPREAFISLRKQF
jgi:iron complex outermembrane receptor protein